MFQKPLDHKQQVDAAFQPFFTVYAGTVPLQPSFLQHYVQIASRKLLLFHGRRNLAVKGRRQHQQEQQQAAGAGDCASSSSRSDLILRLSDLVNSPVMAELTELTLLGPGAELERDLYSNWFSLQVRLKPSGDILLSRR